MKYKKRLSAKKKQQNKLRKSGKYISSINQSGGGGGEFLVSLTSLKELKFTCMAIHPIHPLLAVCDDGERNMLYRIVDSRPNPKFSYISDTAYLAPVRRLNGFALTSVSFHPTLPIVMGSNNDEGQITVWNIQEVIDHIDQVPLNDERRRNQLEYMLRHNQPDDASEFEKLSEEFEKMKIPELNSFATTTITDLKLSCVAFHPTMPFIVVDCRDYKPNPNLSVIKIFHIDDANITEVNKNSIIIPIDPDTDSYNINKTIAFSHDGVFLAATSGEKVRVWIFSPTEKMEEIGNIDAKLKIKSLVFSPREPILVLVCDNGSYDSIHVVKIEKGGLTVLSKNVMNSHIASLSFHPTLPLLVCGFVNFEIKYYVIDGTGDNDTFSELTMFKFITYAFNNLAINNKFLVTCGNNKLYIFTTYDDVLNTTKTVLESFKDMSKTARLSLAKKDLPRDVRDLILSKTQYDNSIGRNIELVKETVGEKQFLDFISTLSTGRDDSDSDPSWVLEVTQQFIDLLKIVPNLLPILVPFKEIVTNYYIPSHRFSNEEYIQTCNQMVELFIIENNLDPESKLVKKIRDVFSNIVSIFINHIEKIRKRNQYNFDLDEHRAEYYRMRIRNDVQSVFIKLFPFLQQLFILNQSAQNNRFIKDINLKKWLEYTKSERDFTIDRLKRIDPGHYKTYGTSKWNEELKELALKRDEARRRRQSQSQGGGTKKKMRSRTYKNKSYKK